MILVNFVRNNILFENEYLLRSSIPTQDSVIATRTSNIYAGVVTANSDRSEYVIDGAIIVKTVPESLREKQQPLWSKRAFRCLAFSAISMTIGFCLGETAFAAAGASTLIPMLAVALICGEIAILVFNRAITAARQEQAWTNPVIKAQKQRKACDPHHQFANEIKKLQIGKIVTHEEAKALFFDVIKVFDGYAKTINLPNVVKEMVIDNFFRTNHFDPKRLRGVFSDTEDLSSPKEPSLIYHREKIDQLSKIFAEAQTICLLHKGIKSKLKLKIGQQQDRYEAENRNDHKLVLDCINQAYEDLMRTTSNQSQLTAARNFAANLCDNNLRTKENNIQINFLNRKRALDCGENPFIEDLWKIMKLFLILFENCRDLNTNSPSIHYTFNRSYKRAPMAILQELSISAHSQLNEFDQETQNEICQLFETASRNMVLKT